MGDLPPDLERLGEALTTATTGEVAARRHRRAAGWKLGACVAAGILVFAATAPSRLVSSDTIRPSVGLAFVDTARADTLRGPCDPPHGGAGRYSQAPDGCEIVQPRPQWR